MQTINAAQLRQDLISENQKLKNDPDTEDPIIRLEEYRVIGSSLDLHRLEFDFPVIFKNCYFEHTIRASYSRFTSLAFYGGTINGIDAIGIECTDNLTFATVDPDPKKRFKSKRRIRLVNGNIGKRLVLNGGIFESRDWNAKFKKLDTDKAISARGAIDADAIKIGSSLWMDRFEIDKENNLPFEAYGLVTIRNATIGGRFVARGACFRSGIFDNDKEDSVNSDKEGFGFVAGLDAFKKSIQDNSSPLDLSLEEVESKYYKELTETYIQCCFSLDMYNITIGSSVQMSYNFISTGTIRLSSATLKGKLSMKGAKLYECAPESQDIETLKQTIWLAESSRLSWGCLDAFKCTIHGSAYLCSVKRVAPDESDSDFDNKFIAMGRVSFSGATIHGRFYMGGARIIKSPDTKFSDEKKTYSLDLAEATVSLNLLLDHDFVSYGGIRIARCNVGGQVVLSSANIFSIGKNTYSINARSAKVDRELRIRDSALIIGVSDFQHVEVGSSVDLSSSVFCLRSDNKKVVSLLDHQTLRRFFINQEKSYKIFFHHFIRNDLLLDCILKFLLADYIYKYYVNKYCLANYLKGSVSKSIKLFDSNINNDSMNDIIHESRCLDFDNSNILGNFCLHPTSCGRSSQNTSEACMIIGSILLNRAKIGGILDIRTNGINEWIQIRSICLSNRIYLNEFVKTLSSNIKKDLTDADTGCKTNIYLNNTSAATLRENSFSSKSTVVSFKGFDFKTIDIKINSLTSWKKLMNRSHYGSSGSMWMLSKINVYHKEKEFATQPISILDHKFRIGTLAEDIRKLRLNKPQKHVPIKFLTIVLSAALFSHLAQPSKDVTWVAPYIGLAVLLWLIFGTLKSYYKTAYTYFSDNNRLDICKKMSQLGLMNVINVTNIKIWTFSLIGIGKFPMHIFAISLCLILFSTPFYSEYKSSTNIKNETASSINAFKDFVPYVLNFSDNPNTYHEDHNPSPNSSKPEFTFRFPSSFELSKDNHAEISQSTKPHENEPIMYILVRSLLPVSGWIIFAFFSIWLSLRFFK